MKTAKTPTRWSLAIVVLGFVLLAVLEFGAAVYAFRTGSRDLMVDTVVAGAQPMDALVRTALSLVAGALAFGGSIIVSYRRSLRKEQRRGTWLPMMITCLAFCYSAFGFSGFTAWSRASASADAYRSTQSYKLALETLKAPSDGSYSAYEDRKDAKQVVEQGSAPATAEREFGDWVRAIAAHGLVIGMASAFRLPAEPAKRKAKKAAKPAQRRRTKRTPVREKATETPAYLN